MPSRQGRVSKMASELKLYSSKRHQLQEYSYLNVPVKVSSEYIEVTSSIVNSPAMHPFTVEELIFHQVSYIYGC